ncbi:uncharacterized protein [Miscanthus floridulus]|uniref:uncharacterized protein isoform X2 n=1 Tax=Miscanthus floridulus TaxID=154761 RepID=UPI0034579A18
MISHPISLRSAPSAVSLEIDWVHGGGYREAVGGGGGSRRRCGSTAQHGCPAGADGRHGQARGPLQVERVRSICYQPGVLAVFLVPKRVLPVYQQAGVIRKRSVKTYYFSKENIMLLM